MDPIPPPPPPPIQTLLRCNHTSDNKSDHRAAESNLFITSMTTDWIGRHEVLLPINKKKNTISERRRMKERENLHWKTDEGGVNRHSEIVIGLFKLQLWLWLVELNFNFECDWLIELSDN